MLTPCSCRSHASGRKGLAAIFLVLCVTQGVLVGYYTVSEKLSAGKGDDSSPHQLESHAAPNNSIKNNLPPTVVNPEIGGNCSDGVCLSNLEIPSRMCYKNCEELAYLRTMVPALKIPKHCKFRTSKGRLPVALVSVPGSGNTWVRGLLEMATGICTGSIYCDAPLRNMGFIGEYVHDGSVLVVKTHTSDYQWVDGVEKRNHQDAFYGSAILLIRNPFDTFVAERNRLVRLNAFDKKQLRTPNDSSHIYQADKKAFNGSSWNGFVYNMSIRWQKTIVKWAMSGHSVLVVRYEDLNQDHVAQVARMLDFLREEYVNRTELARKLGGGFDKFKRKHSDEFEHYTRELKKLVNNVIRETMEILSTHKLEHLFQLRHYLR